MNAGITIAALFVGCQPADLPVQPVLEPAHTASRPAQSLERHDAGMADPADSAACTATGARICRWSIAGPMTTAFPAREQDFIPQNHPVSADEQTADDHGGGHIMNILRILTRQILAASDCWRHWRAISAARDTAAAARDRAALYPGHRRRTVLPVHHHLSVAVPVSRFRCAGRPALAAVTDPSRLWFNTGLLACASLAMQCGLGGDARWQAERDCGGHQCRRVFYGAVSGRRSSTSGCDLQSHGLLHDGNPANSYLLSVNGDPRAASRGRPDRPVQCGVSRAGTTTTPTP